QGAFVHPWYLFDRNLRAEMFATPWQPEARRRARLIFSGDAASPRRRLLVERCRRFVERRSDAHLIRTYEEALSSPSWPRAEEKLVVWMETQAGQKVNLIPWADWPAVLRNCDFCLCPPGYEQKSHRVVECLLQGAIPILHCPEEYDIGMRDGVNCIIVRNGDWETGLARAMDCDFAAIVRMRTEVAELVNKHLSHRGCAQRWLRFMGLDPAALDGVSAA